MSVKSAPRASEATMSAPLRMPVSSMISMSSPTSRTTSGRSSKGTGARSSCRPPWLDRTIASTPRSASFFASASVWTPLTANLPGHISRIVARSSKSIVGSIAELMSSPTVPPVSDRDANSSFSVVRKSHHHQGRGIALRTTCGVSCGGIENPLRLSRRRAPPTGVSTVKKRVSKPAAAARSTRP